MKKWGEKIWAFLRKYGIDAIIAYSFLTFQCMGHFLLKTQASLHFPLGGHCYGGA